MIKANHKSWARFLYDIYIPRLVKKNFSGMYLSNLMPEIPVDKSLLVTPNHISWWDGFFVDMILTKKTSRKIHLMMLEKELSKFRFFSKVGAYSIRQEDIGSVRETTLYTREILSSVSNYCVIYPQGEILPFEIPSPAIKPGIRLILNGVENSMVLPLIFKIQYDNKKYPYVIARFGELLDSQLVVKNFGDYQNIFKNTRDDLNNFIFEKKTPVWKIF